MVEPLGVKLGSIRWRICALLFFANTINYMDRQVLSFLAPMLQVKIGWTEAQYSYIVVAFQLAYALGLLVVGGIIDKIGVKLGYSLTIAVWSLAAISHSLARSALTFGICRFFLGLGESGNFPAAIKTVAEWFPKKERALATGIFNSGTSVGAILVPLTIPWVVKALGWQAAFLFTGGFSLIWLTVWLVTYRSPDLAAKLTVRELAHIRSDAAESMAKVPWASLIGRRETWALLLGKFITDPVWWFLLFWLPKYLASAFGLELTGLALPVMVIYIASTVGSLLGGWLPAKCIEMGMTIKSARRLAMLLCALGAMPLMLVGSVHNLWMAVGIIGFAAASHQGWSANLFTMSSDLFPRSAVGSVTGIMGFGGAIAGMFSAGAVGVVLERFHSYSALFVTCGVAYLLAWTIIQILTAKRGDAVVAVGV
jgi:ACS family hexuronate transporter-like MFS transporter